MIRIDSQTKPSDPADTGLQPTGDGQMWLDACVEQQLQQAGLTDFDAVMATLDGRCLRALKDRENWRLSLQDEQRRPHGIYLKKHHVRTWLTRLRAKWGTGPGETPGRVEAQNVGALTDNGVEVMRLLAYGEKLHADGLLESFVLTEELENYTDLHTFLHHRFPPLSVRASIDRDRDLTRLIREVARVARKFHEAGFNHRDFYCGHFFIRERVPGEFHIRLIDLQRVQHRRRFRRRWMVKDLAQLAWSAPRGRIKCTDKLAFMRCYLGVEKLRPADKRLIRAVLAKQQVMQRRLGIEA
ncbi:MAG: hypothetical protein HQ567_33165 [Candidatus Nealsonbacteria bacterium]|nr:hypothetical protein [Candidatus Nealsonbacteria bacterium]